MVTILCDWIVPCKTSEGRNVGAHECVGSGSAPWLSLVNSDVLAFDRTNMMSNKGERTARVRCMCALRAMFSLNTESRTWRERGRRPILQRSWSRIHLVNYPYRDPVVPSQAVV